VRRRIQHEKRGGRKEVEEGGLWCCTRKKRVREEGGENGK